MGSVLRIYLLSENVPLKHLVGPAKYMQGTELIKVKSYFQEPNCTTFILTVLQL